MANISTLTVSLVAETAKFSNGLKKARRDSSNFGNAIRKSMGIAATAAAAFAGSLAILTRQSFALVDQQRKTARVLGTSQAVYAGLGLAAEISGVGVESLNKALKRQQKSIVDASDGLQTQKRAFDRLNLSAEALIKLPVEQQFSAITSRLAEVEDQTLKVAIASDIWGARNADLINTLELGENGLQGFIDRVEELGVALTDKQTDAIEEANDSIAVMQTAFRGLGNQIAARLAPAVTAAAEAITSIVERVTNAIPKFTAWASSILGVERALDSLTIKDLDAEILQIDSDINDLQGSLKNVRNLLRFNPTDASAQQLESDLAKQLEQLVKRYNDAIRKRKELRDAGEIAIGGPTGGTAAGGDIGREADRVLGSEIISAGLDKFKEDIAESLSLFDEWERQASRAFESTRTPLEQLKLELAEIRANPFMDADLQERTAKDAVDRYLAELERLKKETEEVTEQTNEFWLETMRSMQQSFSDVFFAGFDQGLDDMVDSFKNALKRMLADLAASKLLDFIFGGLGKLFPGLGIPIPGGTSTPLRRVGGPVGAGQSVIGGEGGPELFTPGARGSLRPLGGVAISQENVFGDNANGLTMATLIPILEDNNRKLKAEIMDAFERGAFA